MWNKQSLSGLKILILSMVLLLSATPATMKAGETDANQARAIADIAHAVFTCSSLPCIGEDAQEFKDGMRGRIVSDGDFYYSDLTAVFDGARGILHGDVEWDFKSKVVEADLRFTELEIDPAVLLSELENALPGCQMKREEDDEAEIADDVGGSGEEATRAWSCSAQGSDSTEISVDVYYIRGLLLLEISS